MERFRIKREVHPEVVLIRELILSIRLLRLVYPVCREFTLSMVQWFVLHGFWLKRSRVPKNSQYQILAITACPILRKELQGY